MKIKLPKILILLSVFALVQSLFVFSNLSIPFLKPLISIIYISFVPGILITLNFKVKEFGFWKFILFTLGLSLSFLMLFGLSINWLLPILGITQKPLSFMPINIGLNISLLILGIVSYFRNRTAIYSIHLPKLDTLNKLYFSIPAVFPILSVLGAIRLNNNGSNILTMVMLGAIAIYIYLITLKKDKLDSNIFPWTLWLSGLSLLLMFSLRSPYISGFDISKEYQVFQLTKNNGLWSMKLFQDAYNACLSITVLPTIIANILNIRNEYIYKIIYQIYFSFLTVGIYIFLRGLKIRNELAFLSALVFICSPWFVDPMTVLNRQEISFLYFSLILIVLFGHGLSAISKRFLLGLFTISMVVSHYSTSYIAVLLFILTFFIRNIFITKGWHILGKLAKSSLISNKMGAPSISGKYILFLILSVFVWFSLVTHTLDNISYFTKDMTNSIFKVSDSSLKNSLLNQILSFSSPISVDTYKKYYSEATATYSQKKNISLYSPDTYKGYELTPASSQTIEINNPQVYTVINFVYKFTLVLFELFLVIGTMIIFFKRDKLLKTLDKEIFSICISTAILLSLMLFLPYVSMAYNFDRLYMQGMIIMSILVVVGGQNFFRYIFKDGKYSIHFVSIFLILNFLFTYGFIWQLVGGKSVTWLNNSGYNYDVYYTHMSEISSANWLENNKLQSKYIYTNDPGRNKLWAYTSIRETVNIVLPPVLDKSSYVYSTYSNTIKHLGYLPYRGNQYGYEYPTQFLIQNKNTVYSNGLTVIYK